MSAINGIIQGGASIISSLIAARAASESNKNAARIAKETREFNKEQNDIKYQRDKEMWHAANAYNSPLAQRQRFEEAGINPFLALGRFDSGTASALQSPTPTPASDYGYQSPLGHLATGISSAGQAYLQAKLTEAQIANVNSDTDKKIAETEGIGIQNKYSPELLGAELKLKVEQGNLTFEQALAERFSRVEMQPIQKHLMQKELTRIEKETDLTELKSLLASDELNYMRPLERQEIQAKLINFAVTNKYLMSLARQADANTEKIKNETGVIWQQLKQIRMFNSKFMEKLELEMKRIGVDIDYTEARTEDIPKAAADRTARTGAELVSTAMGIAGNIGNSISGSTVDATGAFVPNTLNPDYWRNQGNKNPWQMNSKGFNYVQTKR